MNAGHTSTTRMARIGRMTGRIALGLALALLLCGIATGGVEAGKKNSFKGKMSSSLTANQYADICDAQGASDIKVTTNNGGGKTVTCSWGNDLTSSCNFKTKTCTDTFREVPEDSGPSVGGDLSVAPELTISDPIADPDVHDEVDPSVAPEPTTPAPTVDLEGVDQPGAATEPASQDAVVNEQSVDGLSVTAEPASRGPIAGAKVAAVNAATTFVLADDEQR